MVCPFLKGSVLETFNYTSIYLGEDFGMNTKSENERPVTFRIEVRIAG